MLGYRLILYSHLENFHQVSAQPFRHFHRKLAEPNSFWIAVTREAC